MTDALLIAVRFYEGRYHGWGDWPPAPGRLFQALLAGSAEGASLPEPAGGALDWLERQAPPTIAAPHGLPGQAFSIYVPNNDIDSKLGRLNSPPLEYAVSEIRVEKRLCPILFDQHIPILYYWQLESSEDKNAAQICEIAKNLYQLGLGIDMAWADGSITSDTEAGDRLSTHGGAIYRPSGSGESNMQLHSYQPGFRQSLTDRFESMRNRFHTDGSGRQAKLIFRQPPKPRFVKIAYNATPRHFVFDLRERDAFFPWPLNQAALLVAEARDKAAEILSAGAPELRGNIERYLIGRGAIDSDKEARVRIVPIPSIGHVHVDMGIRRLAVYVPQTCPLRADDLEWAFSQVLWINTDGVIKFGLQRAENSRMAGRLEEPSREWRSVTPLALQSARRRRIEPSRIADEVKGGHERADEEKRAAAAVRQALRHAGVSTPAREVRLQREPFDRHGERAETFAAGTRFPKEALWHAAVTFTEPVTGPLLLGDGRYLGLGLMRPRESERGVEIFNIADGLSENSRPAIVAQAARRAMMARVQSSLGRGQRLPTYVSGHAFEGSPSHGRGTHRHVAVVVDLPRRRILFLAPTRLHRTGVSWREIAKDHTKMVSALEGMSLLRAGIAGCLSLTPTAIDLDNDPLFASARIWESVTDYDVTRHPHRLDNEEALKNDVTSELQRRGWPLPKSIDVLNVRLGSRGGLSGRLRLTFATAQPGPLVIGRSTHKGGGLFANG